MFVFSWSDLSNLVDAKSKNNGFWESWTFALVPKIMTTKIFWIFRKVEVENYQSPVNLNIPPELLSFPALQI